MFYELIRVNNYVRLTLMMIMMMKPMTMKTMMFRVMMIVRMTDRIIVMMMMPTMGTNDLLHNERTSKIMIPMC